MMCSFQDSSTQIGMLDFVEEENGYAIVPVDLMLDMLDTIMGVASSTTVVNTTVPPDSVGTTNDTNYSEMKENICHESIENLLSLSTLKNVKNQLISIMESIQARSPDLVVETSQDLNPPNYWLERLEHTIGLLQARIRKEE